MIQLHPKALNDENTYTKTIACKALGNMDEKAATNEVINGLCILLRDADYEVRTSAYKALEKMGEKAATNEVINRLLVLLGDAD